MALAALSGDEQRVIFVQLCNPLDPGVAVAFGSASKELWELIAQHGGGLLSRGGGTDQGKVIAAPDDLHANALLDQGEVAVKLAAQLYQQPVVRKFQGSLEDILGRGRRGQGAASQKRWPHAAHGRCGWVHSTVGRKQEHRGQPGD